MISMKPAMGVHNGDECHSGGAAWPRWIVRGVAGLMFAAAVTGVAGCMATAEVEPAVAVPDDYYVYPYTYYDGHIVYFVHGSWYYPSGNRWYHYRRVPPGLERRTGSLQYYREPYGRGGGPRSDKHHR